MARQLILQSAIAPSQINRDRAARAISRAVCGEYGLQNGWPREHIEKLVQESLKEMETAPALALRGWLALEKGQLSKALADAEHAIALPGADARAYLVRGRVRLERGDGTALDDLTRAAELSERKDATVLHWLAAAQAQAGRLAEAVQTQQQAVKLRPADAALADQLRQLEARRNCREVINAKSPIGVYV